MKYINIKSNLGTETVDEFTTYKEAREMLKEYRMSDIYNYYCISQRCTNDWKNR